MKILGILCLLSNLTVAALAAEAPPSDRPVREPSPMMVEIQAALETARLEVAELKLRYEAAVTDQAAMEIAREIASIKRESRVEMLRIQLRYALTEGREETAAQLQEAITRMTTPPAPGEPEAWQPQHR